MPLPHTCCWLFSRAVTYSVTCCLVLRASGERWLAMLCLESLSPPTGPPPWVFCNPADASLQRRTHRNLLFLNWRRGRFNFFLVLRYIRMLNIIHSTIKCFAKLNRNHSQTLTRSSWVFFFSEQHTKPEETHELSLCVIYLHVICRKYKKTG